MLKRPLPGGLCLALCGTLSAQSTAAPSKEAKPQTSQVAKIEGLIHLWSTQMLDNDPRLNTAAPGGYYQLPEGGTENTTFLRRAELHLSGSIAPEVTFKIVAAPQTLSTSSSSPSILQDAYVNWQLNKSFSVRLGQFKPFQGFESTQQSTKDIYFFERAQHSRRFGDKRDRGIVATYEFSAGKALIGKVHFGTLNGMSDATGGRTPDTNAQKDVVSRLDFVYDKLHKFGFYTRDGAADVADKGGMVALAFKGAGAPTAQAVLDNKDVFNNRGLYYAFENDTWIAQAEYVTGLWGRRFASVGTASGSAKRQHLDQTFVGWHATVGYKAAPRHWFVARIDHLDYNSGSDWYGPHNPYTQDVTTGAALGADYTPRYTDIVVGYTYLLNPAKASLGKFMLNYVKRPGNYLMPRAGQSGAQGGDHLVLNYIIAY